MKKIERKDFLILGGGAVLGGLAGWVFSGAPFLGFQWLVEWTQDQYVPVKGIEKFVTSINDACPNGCNKVTVRMLGDRAVKIESKEGVCPSCTNALQLLYHPERIATPLKRKGSKGSGKFESISWDQAIKEISEKMNSLINEGKGNSIAAINKDESLNSQLLERFIRVAGSNNVYYEASLKSLTSNAIGGYINYDFDRTDYILSFGAKLIEGWGSAKMPKMFTQWKNRGTKIVQADSVCTMTASHASEWIPVKPGSEAVLAFGIANYLIKDKRLNSTGEEFGKWSQLIINKFTLENVSKYTGVSIETIKKIGDEFAKAQNPVAVAGKGGAGVSASSAEIIAIYCLNTLVKSRAVNLMANSGVSYKGEFAGLDDFIKNGSFEVLFLNNSNPIYKSVLGNDLKSKMEKAFVVSINPLINDSANYADYILPSLSYLETATSENKQPVVQSFEESKDAKDIIIELSKAVDKTKNTLPVTAGREVASNARFSFNVEKIKNEFDAIEKKLASDAEYPLTLVPVEIPLLGDGDGLAFPFVLKSIDPTVFYKGRLLVQINRETGKKYGLSENGSIVIKSARGKLGKVYVHLTDIVAPDTIAIPIGFGHESYTKYGNNKGVNPKKIMAADVDPLTGIADWWSTRVKIS